MSAPDSGLAAATEYDVEMADPPEDHESLSEAGLEQRALKRKE